MDTETLLNGIKRNWNRPYFYRMRLLENIVAPIHRHLNDEGINMYEKEWDNLIILDACRADLFERSEYLEKLNGTLTTIKSNGSGSAEFLRKTFRRKDCSDTVYVTANPHILTELDSPFYAVDHVWDTGWDDEAGTVKPETMVKRAIGAHGQYPNKRLIIHFMQPHYPFIGESKVTSDGLGLLRSKARGDESAGQTDKDVWARLSNGEASKEEVWEGYRQNLELAMESVTKLLKELNGLSVITADHGNALGERAWPIPLRVFGHPNGINIEALREVPWFICEYEEKREIKRENRDSKKQTKSDITDRLEALGYR